VALAIFRGTPIEGAGIAVVTVLLDVRALVFATNILGAKVEDGTVEHAVGAVEVLSSFNVKAVLAVGADNAAIGGLDKVDEAAAFLITFLNTAPDLTLAEILATADLVKVVARLTIAQLASAAESLLALVTFGALFYLAPTPDAVDFDADPLGLVVVLAFHFPILANRGNVGVFADFVRLRNLIGLQLSIDFDSGNPLFVLGVRVYHITLSIGIANGRCRVRTPGQTNRQYL